MDTAFSNEDLKFQSEIREFIKTNYPQELRDSINSKRKLGKELSREDLTAWHKILGKHNGWSAPSWPKQYGGAEFTPTQKYIFEQECAKAECQYIMPFGINMVGPVIYTFGNEEQKAQHLPGILSGEVFWCQGYSEPGAGSDLANLQTRAVLSDDGTHYVVNGQKIWTTLAHIAHWMFCLTRTDNSGAKQEGITFLLIPMDDPGIEVRPIITLGGSHSVNEVYLTDVVVPVEQRVGEEGKGWTYAKGLLSHERTGLAGIQNSVLALEKAKQNARSIPLGDGTLLDQPNFRSKVGALEAELLALEFTEIRTLAQVAAGGSPGPESSILKLKGTEIQQRISELNLEAGGLFGSAWGLHSPGPSFARGATQHYLGGRATTIYGGASEVQKDVIAKNVLGMG